MPRLADLYSYREGLKYDSLLLFATTYGNLVWARAWNLHLARYTHCDSLSHTVGDTHLATDLKVSLTAGKLRTLAAPDFERELVPSIRLAPRNKESESQTEWNGRWVLRSIHYVPACTDDRKLSPD